MVPLAPGAVDSPSLPEGFRGPKLGRRMLHPECWEPIEYHKGATDVNCAGRKKGDLVLDNVGLPGALSSGGSLGYFLPSRRRQEHYYCKQTVGEAGHQRRSTDPFLHITSSQHAPCLQLSQRDINGAAGLIIALGLRRRPPFLAMLVVTD